MMRKLTLAAVMLALLTLPVTGLAAGAASDTEAAATTGTTYQMKVGGMT